MPSDTHTHTHTYAHTHKKEWGGGMGGWEICAECCLVSPAGQSMILRNASTHSAALTTWGAATCLLTTPALTAQALI